MDVNKLRMRRATAIAIAIGVLALMATGALDRWLLGVFMSAGLALGWLNARLTWMSIVRITDAETPSKQKLALSSASRLLILTALSIVIAYFTRPYGVGIFFGLAVFQLILILHTVVPEVKGLRQQS
ncbi:ATP synthase subunit I [Nocardia sp. NPDC088792]|uniref:ATP synthase subunit I n=1 Tax=Nocardia sp. NPDC088792 TaxID=3364332 RepID=UPI003817AF28